MRFDKTTLALIAPGIKDHLKYSPRLYSWVKKRAYQDLEAYAVDRSGSGGSPTCIYIGVMDERGFTGKALNQILCATGQAGYYPGMKAKLIPDFWDRYIARGRCYLDPEHNEYYMDERWDLKPSGKHRECLWCGHCQEKVTFIHTEERSRWKDAENETSLQRHPLSC